MSHHCLRCRVQRLKHALDSLPYRLHRAKWWALHRFHPRHRYHVVRTGLTPGWVDRGDLMALLIVQTFKDFVEKEKPFEWFDTENGPNPAQWARVRQVYEQIKDMKPDDFYGTDRNAVLTETLIEIVRLRDTMWT